MTRTICASIDFWHRSWQGRNHQGSRGHSDEKGTELHICEVVVNELEDLLEIDLSGDGEMGFDEDDVEMCGWNMDLYRSRHERSSVNLCPNWERRQNFKSYTRYLSQVGRLTPQIGHGSNHNYRQVTRRKVAYLVRRTSTKGVKSHRQKESHRTSR
jgi:hypothetical protein